MSAFSDLIQLAKEEPESYFRLVDLAGGNPFEIDKVDLQKVRNAEVQDELSKRYVEAVDSIMRQIENFTESNVE